MKNCALVKAERLNSKLIIDKLFAGGNVSMAAFPLRVVFMRIDKKDDARLRTMGDGAHGLPPVSVLVSVPKKRFRHAVDRNRMKRLVREAYRLNKQVLWNALADKDYRLVLAFVCITNELPSFDEVQRSVRKMMVRIAEKTNN